MPFRRLLATALIASALLLLADPSLAATLRRGNGAEPGSLDPHYVSGSWENNIIGDMFVGLMTENAAGEAIPGAAESYTVSEDGRIYTFTIREGHVWSDGTPVTAEDFVFSLRRIMDPITAAEYASILYVIDGGQAVNSGEAPVESLGVRAIDSRTLEITLANPAPFFIELLTHFTTFPVPPHVIAEHGKEWIKPDNVVSNGAYTLVEWRAKDYIHLTKNPSFYDADNVAIEDVYFHPTQDASAALKRFRARELDVNSGAPSQQLDWLRENMPESLRIAPYVVVSYLAFNTDREPYGDPRIRQALSMALEREVFTECILRAGQTPAYSFVPPGIANFPGGTEMDFKGLPREERLARANALLAEAGYTKDNPLRMEFGYRESNTGRRIAVLIQAMWKELDAVRADLLRTEVRVHYNNLRSGDFEVGDAGWIADYNDAQNFLFLVEGSSGQMNYGRYANPRFDALMNAAAAELDLEKRGALLAEAEAIVVRDQPLMPLWFGVSLNLVRPYVTGWEDNVTNVHRTRFLKIDEDAQAKAPGARELPRIAHAYGLGCARG